MRALLLSLLIFYSAILVSQNYNPDFNEEYVQDFVPTIRVTMADSAYQWMIHPDNIWSDDYQHATTTYTGSDSITLSYLDMGIRLRGNTSRAKVKKSYKLHFEKFTDDQYFYGLKKLNLKADVNDPTAVREHMVMNIYREANIPVARVNHIKLYINTEYMGLYSSIEQVDSRFLFSRFNNDQGNLFKCVYGADLAHVNDVYNNAIYEIETNEDINDRSNLEAFVNFLSTSSDIDFENNIASYLNVDDYIKQLAIEVLVGHWDGYSYNKNNFYLYYNPDSLWFEYIPYDTDNTLGIDWMGRDWSDRDIYDWAMHNVERPLYNRILNIEKYARLYTKNIDDLIENIFNTTHQMEIAYSYKNLISDAIYADNYYPIDFGFSTQTFESSYTTNADNHVKYGIEPFIEKRASSALTQLNQTYLSIVDNSFNSTISVYPSPLSQNKSLTISSNSAKLKSLNISLVNTLGQQIYTTKIQLSNTNTIDLSFLQTGMYFLQIVDKESFKITSKKIIVK